MRARLCRLYGITPRQLGCTKAALAIDNPMRVERLLAEAVEAVAVVVEHAPRDVRPELRRRALGGLLGQATAAGWPRDFSGPIVYGSRWRGG